MSDQADEDHDDMQQQAQQFSFVPRSVKDFATEGDLREALSRLLPPSLEASHDTSDYTRVSNHCPYTVEPDPEYDIDWRVDNVDRAISYEQTVEREMNRLLVLKSYLELDYEAVTARNCAFDRLTGLAKRSFHAPACFVFLLDIGRSWALSQEGKQFNLVPRKDTFCGHVIVSKEDCFIVPDASKDARFQTSAYVTAENGVRFYAASPLKSPEGFNIGTFCIVDTVPRATFAPEDQEALKDFAGLAMDALVHQRELHCKRRELDIAARRLASASHDLLTPLSVVQLSISLLNEDNMFLGRLDETQREYIKAVSSSSEAMAGVCQSLRHKLSEDTSQEPAPLSDTATEGCTAGSLDSEISTVRVACTKTRKFIQRLNELASITMTSKTVPLSISVDKLVPDVWVGNEVQMLHICLHLLVNSVERTSQGQVNFAVRLAQSCEQSELVFECTETGVATSDSVEELGDIFAEQVLSSYSAKAQETREHENHDGRSSPPGILSSESARCCGLYECFPSALVNQPSLEPFSAQIQSLGGSFGVTKTADSSDITFWFTVPLLLPDENHAGRNGRIFEEPTQSPSNAKTAALCHEAPQTALVVDDSVIMRKMLCRALEQLGYETFQAADGLEGLERLKERTYDLVLLDQLMPVMDGIDCIRAYRQWEQRHRPGYTQSICGMSAHASSNDIDRAIMHGMTEYRPKPLNMADLRHLKDSTMLWPRAKDRHQEKVTTSQAVTVTDSGTSKDVELSRVLLPPSANILGPLQPGKKVCLLAIREDNAVEELTGLIAETDWHSYVTHNGSEALHLLKTRNWGAVIVDVELAEVNGLQCIASFRQWEKHNRVHRQNNMLLTGLGVKSHTPGDQMFIVQLPEGVDAAVERPMNRNDLASILDGIVERETFEEHDIITLG